jgi:hypothetical protein
VRRKTKGVRKNTRAIARLQREQTKRFNYNFTVHEPTITTNFIGQLIAPLEWVPKFNTISDVAAPLDPQNEVGNGTKAFLQHTKHMLTIAMNPSRASEGTPVDYTIFLFTLRNATARATLTRTVDLTALDQGSDYTAALDLNNQQAFWELNPALYNVKAKRSGTLGVYTVASTGQLNPSGNVKDCQQNHTIHVPFKKNLTNGGIMHFKPTWREMEAPDVPISNRLYFICFHNGIPRTATEGQQIGIAMKSEFTGYVPI